MSSWRDIISIQAEWNEALYPPALAETFVDEIMGLMLMLL